MTSTLSEAHSHPATSHARKMLAELGMSCDDAETIDTPARFVRAILELTEGTQLHPERHLAVQFPAPSEDPGMIIARGVPFVSVCEHHLLPFTGTAAVAYLPKPGAPIVGLSKLARVAIELAARPQVQERLGDQIVTAIASHLDTLGVACILRATHSCMVLRGARATGGEMITSHMQGVFRDKPEARAEFTALALSS